MNWNIVADSSIDLFKLEQEFDNINFITVPFTMTVGDKQFVDDESMDIPALMAAMKESKTASSSACPAVGAWLEHFEKDGNVIAITITSNLSGSYSSACAAKDIVAEKYPEKNIHVIDSLSVGPEMNLVIREVCRLISEGRSFEEVVKGAADYAQTTRCSFALLSFDNLVKNGRMSKLKGFVANTLGLCGVGIASEIGTIEIKGIGRGRKKALKIVIDDMEERCVNGVSHVVIDHCLNEKFTEEVRSAVLEKWPEAEIRSLPCRGLCSYYAEMGGLIIGFC